MAKFMVTYEETLSRTVIIDAEDADEAEDIMMDAVWDERVVLGSDDFVSGYYSVEVADDTDIAFYEELEKN